MNGHWVTLLLLMLGDSDAGSSRAKARRAAATATPTPSPVVSATPTPTPIGKWRVIDGKPVQGPVRPPLPTPTPIVYPIFGSLEEIAKLADDVRRRKAGIVYVPEAPSGTPAGTPIPLDPNGANDDNLYDAGELLDVVVVSIDKDNREAFQDLSEGNEQALGVLSASLGEDKILPSPYSERFEEGVAAVQQNKLQEAAEIFREIRQQRPKFLAAWILEVGLWAKLDKIDEATNVVSMMDKVFPEAKNTPFVDKVRNLKK